MSVTRYCNKTTYTSRECTSKPLYGRSVIIRYVFDDNKPSNYLTVKLDKKLASQSYKMSDNDDYNAVIAIMKKLTSIRAQSAICLVSMSTYISAKLGYEVRLNKGLRLKDKNVYFLDGTPDIRAYFEQLVIAKY